MTVELGTAGGTAAGPVDARAPTLDDGPALARLMLDAYAGTIDDDGGATIDDAAQEVARLFAGAFGGFDRDASLVIDRDGVLASATLITRNTGSMKGPIGVGEAFLAFSMTAPAFKRQGLARAGLVAVMARLRRHGDARLHLVVTRASKPALRLYESLGFVVAQ